MFINNLDPVAVTIFNIDIRWYSLAYIFGLILAIQFGKFLIKKNNFFNFNLNILDEYLPFAIIGIILGGRLGYVFFYDLNFFIQNPINIFFMELKPSDLIILLSNQAIKEMNAIAKITPGIAYPEIDKVDKKFSVLFLETLFP